MEDVAKRIAKVFKNSKADVIFLMNTDHQDSNFTYLTNFTSGVFEGNPLIVTKKEIILPVSILEYEIAKEQRPKGMKIIKINKRGHIKAISQKYMKSKVVGINGSFLPYSYYRMLKKLAKPKKIIDVELSFSVARTVKDNDELANIRIANKIAKKAIAQTKNKLEIGMTEKQVAAMIDYHMMKSGASGASFPSIVAFNRNSALPHHMPDNTHLSKNSIVLMDIGAKYNNYCSDLTRTFVFKPDSGSIKYKRFTEIYRIVKEAQLLGFKKIKPNEYGSTAHKAAADHIDKAMNGKYKGTFIHSLRASYRA